MRYTYIFFDLDGTLWDSREGITKGVQYALSRMGIEEPDLKKLECFIGPPLTESFPEYYGFSLEQARQGVVYYREYFDREGIYQNKLFPGVRRMLETLRADGRILCTASSKPETAVRETMENFGITDCFDYICGGSLDESRCTKPKVIEELLRRLDLSEEQRKQVLMVGDRRHDVEGAAAFGIPCLGVSLGFAPEGELEKAGAIGVVDSMEELTAYILSH
ncbi:MAG: HAD hydrolase-like protein [Eubacteriales bacterium]|nr:HAD hydrolase-like protein [Eubacteriales bacterium]